MNSSYFAAQNFSVDLQNGHGIRGL